MKESKKVEKEPYWKRSDIERLINDIERLRKEDRGLVYREIEEYKRR